MGKGCTPLCGLYGDVPLDRVWSLASVLNRVSLLRSRFQWGGALSDATKNGYIGDQNRVWSVRTSSLNMAYTLLSNPSQRRLLVFETL